MEENSKHSRLGKLTTCMIIFGIPWKCQILYSEEKYIKNWLFHIDFQLIVLDTMKTSKNQLHITYFQDHSIGVVNIESCKEQTSWNETVAIRHATNYYDLDIAQVNTTNTFFELKNHIT